MPGPFQIGKYEADDGKIYPVRIQPETLITDFNAEPAGGITEDQFAHARFSGRKYGVFCRSAVLGKQLGTGEGPYVTGNTYARIPILSKASYDAVVIGETITYQGNAFVVISKHAERIR